MNGRPSNKTPFGITNAPSTFMRLMNEVLKEYVGKVLIVYLDELMIFRQSKEENLENVKMVLNTLQKEKLLINLKKCSFMNKELIYLGFIFPEEGLKMDLENIQVILDWLASKCICGKEFSWY